MIKDIIRRFKISYEIYNYFKKDQLIHNERLYKKYGVKKRYYSSVSSKDFEHLPEQKNWLETSNSKDVLPTHEFFQNLPTQFQNGLINWSDQGYAILPKLFEKEADLINTEIDNLLKSETVKWKYGNKIMFAIHHSKLLTSIGLNSQINGILKMLLGRKVELFQSINFLTGSGQRTHSDFVHMSTYPKGNLIAIWIALEDMSEENGPLHYYPGSHLLPCVLNEDYENQGNSILLGDKTYDKYEDKIEELIEEKKLKKQKFIAKKGDVLIWHSNLLHGGEPVIDPKSTRKSMVFHYYAHDVICYHEITQRPTIMEKLPTH